MKKLEIMLFERDVLEKYNISFNFIEVKYRLRKMDEEITNEIMR